MFSFGKTNPGATGNPTTSGAWKFITLNEGQYGFQLAMQTDTNVLYFRRYYVGVLYSWTKIAFTS